MVLLQVTMQVYAGTLIRQANQPPPTELAGEAARAFRSSPRFPCVPLRSPAFPCGKRFANASSHATAPDPEKMRPGRPLAPKSAMNRE